MARGKGLPLDPVRLRAARTAAGLSQRQVAEMLGTTRQQLIRYESGAERPEVQRLAALAAAVGVGVGDLVEPGALPAGLAGLRVEAGLTLAAAATAVRAHLPAGSGVACSRPVLADAERGTLPPSWAPPPAAGAVQGALRVAYGTDVDAVAAAWKTTFGATATADQDQEETGSINHTPDEGLSETTPPAPVDGDTEPPLEDPAVVHLDLLTPQETDATAMGAARMWRVRRGQTPVGFVWRTNDAHQKWAGARANADGGLGDIASLSPTVHRTRKSVVDHLLDPASSYFTTRSTQQPPAEGTDTEARAVAVLLKGDPTAERPRLGVHVDGDLIGHLEPRGRWDGAAGWVVRSHPTAEERRTLTDAELGGRPPEAVTTLTDPAAAVRELLPQVLEEGVYIGSLHGYHTGLKVRPQGMDRWELYQGRVPGRYDVYTGSTCHGWLQNAPGGGFTAHVPDGPVAGGPWPTQGEAVAALWAHLNAPLPPPWLSAQVHAKRSVRKRFDTRPMCPYTDRQLAAARVSEAQGSEKGNRVYEIRVAGDLVGTVRRNPYAKKHLAWEATADAEPNRGQVRPPRAVRGTREDAVAALLSRPGPLWADPTSQTLHPPGHTDTPAPDPGPGAVVDMTERIGPGWALHREGKADAHTWLLVHQGQVRGMVRRYRPRSGGLSRGWEALAGAGGGFLRRSATQQGKLGARSSFLWRSRDLAAWGIATDPAFTQPNPAWARRRPTH